MTTTPVMTPNETPATTPRHSDGKPTSTYCADAERPENLASRIESKVREEIRFGRLRQVARRWFASENVETYASGARVEAAAVSTEEFLSSWRGERITVPRLTTHTQAFHVQAGASLQWQFFVVSNGEIGFSLRKRLMGPGGSVEENVIAPCKHSHGIAVSGDWTNCGNACQLVACFDNTAAKFRATTVIFRFTLVKQPPQLRPAALRIPSLDDSPGLNVLNMASLSRCGDDDDDDDRDDD